MSRPELRRGRGRSAWPASSTPTASNGLFCDGAETCNAGVCQAGTPPACDDGLFCNGTETCNEGTDSCDAGTPPNCDDGVSCTDDSCNEGTDSCDNVANDAHCDDGLFCNGTETCDAVNDCQGGTAPCTGGQTCNETTDVCERATGSSVWMSFNSNTAVPGVGTVSDDDIVSYDETTGTWALEFDGSDVGLTQDIDGFAILPGGDFLISMQAAGSAGGVSFDDSDVLRFTGTGGPNTSGTLSLYFDGSDVGLTSNGEDVDAWRWPRTAVSSSRPRAASAAAEPAAPMRTSSSSPARWDPVPPAPSPSTSTAATSA